MHHRPMTCEWACQIQEWTYEAPYDFYNQSPSEEGIAELMTYQVIVEEHELIGFYCIGSPAQVPNSTYPYCLEFTDIGLGMRPDMTGKGHGRLFVTYVMERAMERGKPLRLTVAAFNERAIHLYDTVGFRTITSFERNGTPFKVMVRD
ncbi:GNAT family N-acetyltransferase [Exiguobacterium sp. N5]|uniref:GNAT family N-acetyltransferase n=1 Tax=Exiguobacterium sp. N5 TaxID=2990450 RepID=UPI0021F3CA53|nr:GNAT family N-acetyltransferase [Exiguobacterium sp. N5]MCV9900531.1 GNAT family N-acetyltransferase [Exiguobacterium sp. N5]